MTEHFCVGRFPISPAGIPPGCNTQQETLVITALLKGHDLPTHIEVKMKKKKKKKKKKKNYFWVLHKMY